MPLGCQLAAGGTANLQIQQAELGKRAILGQKEKTLPWPIKSNKRRLYKSLWNSQMGMSLCRLATTVTKRKTSTVPKPAQGRQFIKK